MIKDKTFKPSPCYLTAIKTVEIWRSQSQSQFLAVTYDGKSLSVFLDVYVEFIHSFIAAQPKMGSMCAHTQNEILKENMVCPKWIHKNSLCEINIVLITILMLPSMSSSVRWCREPLCQINT